MEIYVNQIVLTAIGIAVGGAIGYVTGVLKKSRASEKAMATIMKALARDYVKDAYQKYIVEEHTMTIAAYRRARRGLRGLPHPRAGTAPPRSTWRS